MRMAERVEVLYTRLDRVNKEFMAGDLSCEEMAFLGMRGYYLISRLTTLLRQMKSDRAMELTQRIYLIAYEYTIYGGKL